MTKLTQLCKGTSLLHKIDQPVGCRSFDSSAIATQASHPLLPRPREKIEIILETRHFVCVMLFGKCYNNANWLLLPFTRLTSQPLADNHARWACAVETYKMRSSLSICVASRSLEAVVTVRSSEAVGSQWLECRTRNTKVAAGAAGEFSYPGSTFCAECLRKGLQKEFRLD